MKEPVLLDLFCGAGGAAVGYARAGFRVVGVDIKKQPRYPFEFIQADAITFPLHGFDAVHASPPCQAYSSATPDQSMHPTLIGVIKRRFRCLGVPWIIENVEGAYMPGSIVLCGTMFPELRVLRHRKFLSNVPLTTPPHPKCYGLVRTGDYLTVTGTGRGWHKGFGTHAQAMAAMDIDWMKYRECVQAVPPAYTEYIGGQIMPMTRGGRVILR